MKHKVLLADDSLTIQKVIKITLANQPYEIIDCSTDEELFRKLPEVQPALVFLDFNLSENYTGYELTSKIKSMVPAANVLLLLGTFDSVDDASMEKCGASDKIVKPFDSNKFISICKRLVELSGEVEDIPYPAPKKEKTPLIQPEEDQWQVSHSVEVKPVTSVKTNEEPLLKAKDNALEREMTDWGMIVPGIISDHNKTGSFSDLPPVIGEVKSLQEQRNKSSVWKEETKFPDASDLDYPTFEDMEKVKEAPVSRPASKLLSIDTFNNVEGFEIEHQINSMDETDISKIEAQIRDEVEENLWQVDEFEELKREVSSKIEDFKGNFQPTINDFDQSLFKTPQEDSIPWDDVKTYEHTSIKTSYDHDQMLSQLREEMDSMIKKHVQEYMDQMFKKNVEKVSWEVIPDLAENLIRQELSKISHKILKEQN
jgi:DNA-binding response OmpR family regulator